MTDRLVQLVHRHSRQKPSNWVIESDWIDDQQVSLTIAEAEQVWMVAEGGAESADRVQRDNQEPGRWTE